MCFEAFSQCPIKSKWILYVVNVSLKPMHQQVHQFQQFLLRGLKLFFDCDLRCFAIEINILLLIHGYSLKINHLTPCIVLGRSCAREILPLRIFFMYFLMHLAHACVPIIQSWIHNPKRLKANRKASAFLFSQNFMCKFFMVFERNPFCFLMRVCHFPVVIQLTLE